jgi:hypothetical protein
MDFMNDLSRHAGNNSDEYRPPFGGMSEDEVEDLVGRAAQKVMDNFYRDIGKSVAQKILWVIGLATVSLIIWLASIGKLKGI